MLNAYMRRREARLAKQHVRQHELNLIEKQNRYLLMEAYNTAHWELYREHCRCTYHNGWYKINGESVREGVLRQMIELMKAKVHEREIEVPGVD